LFICTKIKGELELGSDINVTVSTNNVQIVPGFDTTKVILLSQKNGETLIVVNLNDGGILPELF
jgi:hypothetical protein